MGIVIYYLVWDVIKFLHKRFCHKYLNIYALLVSLKFFKLLKQHTILEERKDKIWDMSQTNIIYKYNINVCSLKSREDIQKKSLPKTVRFQIMKKLIEERGIQSKIEF